MVSCGPRDALWRTGMAGVFALRGADIQDQGGRDEFDLTNVSDSDAANFINGKDFYQNTHTSYGTTSSGGPARRISTTSIGRWSTCGKIGGFVPLAGKQLQGGHDETQGADANLLAFLHRLLHSRGDGIAQRR